MCKDAGRRDRCGEVEMMVVGMENIPHHYPHSGSALQIYWSPMHLVILDATSTRMTGMEHNVSGHLCSVQATRLSRISSCMDHLSSGAIYSGININTLPRYHPLSNEHSSITVHWCCAGSDRSPDLVCMEVYAVPGLYVFYVLYPSKAALRTPI